MIGRLERVRVRGELIGHLQPCITEIYLHIFARMTDYIATQFRRRALNYHRHQHSITGCKQCITSRGKSVHSNSPAPSPPTNVNTVQDHYTTLAQPTTKGSFMHTIYKLSELEVSSEGGLIVTRSLKIHLHRSIVA